MNAQEFSNWYKKFKIWRHLKRMLNGNYIQSAARPQMFLGFYKSPWVFFGLFFSLFPSFCHSQLKAFFAHYYTTPGISWSFSRSSSDKWKVRYWFNENLVNVLGQTICDSLVLWKVTPVYVGFRITGVESNICWFSFLPTFPIINKTDGPKMKR